MDDIKYPARWRRWSEKLLSIFPCTCLACHQPAPSLLCQQCRGNLSYPENCCIRCGETLPDGPATPQVCGRCLAAFVQLSPNHHQQHKILFRFLHRLPNHSLSQPFRIFLALF